MRDFVLLKLEGIADTYLLGMKMPRQELVIISSSTADTVTMMVKHDARNKNQIDSTLIGRSLRFRHTKVALAHHILAVIRTNLH